MQCSNRPVYKGRGQIAHAQNFVRLGMDEVHKEWGQGSDREVGVFSPGTLRVSSTDHIARHVSTTSQTI